VTYLVEFNFGLDVSPRGLEVVTANNGVSLKINRPTLVGEPIIKVVSHQLCSVVALADDRAVLAEAQAKFAELVRRYGTAMSTEATVQATCKLKALEGLRDALSTQTGVVHLPGIFVEFR
jgi:hypothetical protein